jgi:RNA polymerase sigma-B factor
MSSRENRQSGRQAQSSPAARVREDRDGRPTRDQLLERHLPLARKLARRYLRPGESFDDLVQVASVGLLKAIDRFDPERGTALTTYAVPTIVGELKRHFRDHGWAVHLERTAKERALAVLAARRALEDRAGRPPTVGELAQYLEYGIEDTLDALQAATACEALSLDEPVAPADGGHSLSRLETIGAGDPELELADERLSVREALRRLPKVEREVLYLRFAEGLSQVETAARVGVSQMQVSRLQRRSLGRLRGLIDGELDAGVPRSARDR